MTIPEMIRAGLAFVLTVNVAAVLVAVWRVR